MCSNSIYTIFTFLLLSALALPTRALYFYMDGTHQKCFFEELPKDTLVVGQCSISPSLSYSRSNLTLPGHYEAQQYNPSTQTYQPDPSVGVLITVEETFDNDHRIVNQRGSASGRFTFSAADSGEHRLCFTPLNAAHSSGWLSGGVPQGGIKMTLDLAIGETSNIESADKGKIGDIVGKVRDLNGRLGDIRREQVFQRVSGRCLLGRQACGLVGRIVAIRWSAGTAVWAD